METYTIKLEKYNNQLISLKATHKSVSIARLTIALVFLAAIYLYSSGPTIAMVVIVGALLSFVYLMKRHQILSAQIEITKAIISINQNEIDFLNGKKEIFDTGEQYRNHENLYAYDLDIFGPQSLYEHIERTATFMGGKKLATLLQSSLSAEKIPLNQQSIKELATKIDWRQNILATGMVNMDSEQLYSRLKLWCKNEQRAPDKNLNAISYILPSLLFAAAILYFYLGNVVFKNMCYALVTINLIIIGAYVKRIKHLIEGIDKIHKTISQYGFILEQIENEKFESIQLKNLQAELTKKNTKASGQIKKLAILFSQMENIQNAFGAALMNGLFLYHIRVYNNLLKWHKENASSIGKWLSIIGEIETLNSLANFSYNNPLYTFPELNANHIITFNQLGHPLIHSEKRICNDVNFENQKLMIITGSNMSGKSTFLRTLGVNMVLAGIGAPVCATKANIHPLDIIVSMRIDDSLSDSESYFFAEVKKLQKIMQMLDTKSCFVLLDEILRGTNSDDKRSGTIEVIKKLVSKKAIGAIATHDLEVCLTKDEFPDYIVNQCFEVEIVNNELQFDYKLREGVCKNKSATFMMKKMGVI